jgi:hypothetical protein
MNMALRLTFEAAQAPDQKRGEGEVDETGEGLPRPFEGRVQPAVA